MEGNSPQKISDKNTKRLVSVNRPPQNPCQSTLGRFMCNLPHDNTPNISYGKKIPQYVSKEENQDIIGGEEGRKREAT